MLYLYSTISIAIQYHSSRIPEITVEPSEAYPLEYINEIITWKWNH